MEQMEGKNFEQYCRKLDSNREDILTNLKDLKQLGSDSSLILENQYKMLAILEKMEDARIKGFEAKLDYGQMDLLQKEDDLFISSEVHDLYDQLNVIDHVGFVIFDVGDGKQWLSSRLYLFTTILQEIYSLKCIVFVGEYNNTWYQFLGSANPDRV
jgi:uncharacterized protein YfbU (UPF0304 family)